MGEKNDAMCVKKIARFLSITFSITGVAWIGLAVLTQARILTFSHPAGMALHVIGGFGPTIAALAVMDGRLTARSVLSFIFRRGAGSMIPFWLLSIMALVTIGLSSGERNAAMPLWSVPVVFLQAVLIYGGEEELGWRGTMQPILEKRHGFLVAAATTGAVWGVWHLPLWFVEGSSQQDTPFPLFLVLAVVLSFWLAAIHKRTQCVFACSVFHGLINTLMSAFVIKLNAALVLGLVVMLAYSLYLGNGGDHEPEASAPQ